MKIKGLYNGLERLCKKYMVVDAYSGANNCYDIDNDILGDFIEYITENY